MERRGNSLLLSVRDIDILVNYINSDDSTSPKKFDTLVNILNNKATEISENITDDESYTVSVISTTWSFLLERTVNIAYAFDHESEIILYDKYSEEDKRKIKIDRMLSRRRHRGDDNVRPFKKPE
ncbi:MAG: hypothetical protein M3Q14_02720 [bacterium]|nr:hypothetical protein [bacterium]